MAQRLLLAASLLFFSVLQASPFCDHPGTPKNLNATIRQGLAPMVVLTWEDRASEKVWWDVEISDGSGRPVDSPRPGVGRGDQGLGLHIEQSFSVPANGTRCFRVKARNESGNNGCVSEQWSNQACITVGNGGPLASGPDTCKTGFVWRETTPADHVCVDPHSRDDAKLDNSKAAQNRAPNRGDTCKNGLVWREASPNDHVCVSPPKREATKAENAAAAANKVRP
jgi:hypothetical protein